MFSFIKKYTESLAGADVYGDIGLLLFVVVFLAMLIIALTARKEYMHEISEIPLNDSTKE